MRKTLQPLDLRRMRHLGAIGIRSSSKRSLVVRRLAPGNWIRSELRIEMSQAIRQMIQVFLASRNRSDERNQQKLEKLKIG